MPERDLIWYLNAVNVATETYRAFLKRDPGEVGIANVLFHCREEGWTGSDVVSWLKDSPEYRDLQSKPPEPEPPQPEPEPPQGGSNNRF